MKLLAVFHFSFTVQYCLKLFFMSYYLLSPFLLYIYSCLYDWNKLMYLQIMYNNGTERNRDTHVRMTMLTPC